MVKGAPRWTLGQIAEIVQGELEGPADLPIDRPVPAGHNDRRGIAFVEAAKYVDRVLASTVGAVFAPPGLELDDRPIIRVDSPRTAFFILLQLSHKPLPIHEGIHPTAIVHPSSKIHPSARVGSFAVVEQHATIGADARVYSFAYVGENCHVGDSSVLFPHVVLIQDVTLGERCIIHSGAVIGADGFGFMWDGTKRLKIPQVGGVTIGSDVEIGAITAIDRATAGETTIGNGTKLDNLIQVAHNVQMGEHGVVAALTGISGSARIGDRATIAGQVAIIQGIEICDDVALAGRSGVVDNITKAGEYFGAPAKPAREGMRMLIAQAKVPELAERIRRLEREVEELKKVAG